MSFEVSTSLIEKYSVSGPRYTSYPTALSFKEGISLSDWENALCDFVKTHKEAALYVHVPFCPSLCLFCACNKVITKRTDIIDKHIDFLVSEIENSGRKFGSSLKVTQLHFGGGSPSYLSIDRFERIIDAINKSFPAFKDDAEISIEVDPRTTDKEKLSFYRSAGVTRISLGVQDFDPEVQKIVHRIQPFEMTRDIINEARKQGFIGTNIDLIYGLPGQTELSFTQTIDQVISLRPSRIARYGYAHVPWIKKAQESFSKAARPNPKERIALFMKAREALMDVGYQHIGLDHFALPDDELALALKNGTLQRNFMGYTSHISEAIIAFGTSAISSLPSMMVQNIREIAEYNRSIKESGSAIERGCCRNLDDQIRGEIIQKILGQGEVIIRNIESKWGIEFWNYFADVSLKLQEFSDDGLIDLNAERICLTMYGRLLARNIAMSFDKYLCSEVKTVTPTFSQAI